MDTRYEIPPRLRLNRQAYSFAATVDESNIYATLNGLNNNDSFDRDSSEDGSGVGGGDDDGSTPRLGMSKMSVDSVGDIPTTLNFSAQAQAMSTPFASGREREGATPAERLRAVLSRAGSATPTARVQSQSVVSERTPSGDSASLLDSDTETPRNAANGNSGMSSTPFPRNRMNTPPESAARASLRSIFDRALSSPGNTPERPQRTRRGSMDSSFAEDSPIRWSMLRAGGKVKRLSLSDDEKERIRAASSINDRSFLSSQAAAYDQLRARLENSSKSSSVSKSDNTIDMEEATEVEQELFSEPEPPVRSTTPPVPPNMTLGQSASQFPSQFLGSNLLVENSDMRQMIQEAQGETTDRHENDDRTPTAGPSHLKNKPSFVRERALSVSSSVGSLSPSSTSRPTSRQSMNGLENVERKRELERGWNHPLGPYMERHRANSPGLSPTHSGGFAQLRKVSLGSISGSESNDGRASPNILGQRPGKFNSLGRTHSSPNYAGLSANRLSTSSPNQIRVSARARTVSQPSKPGSPRSLGISTSTNGTQRPLDRTRTTSLTVRDFSRPSSSAVHGRFSPRHVSNGVLNMEQSDRSASPSVSRPSSRTSSQVSEDFNNSERSLATERNRNAHKKVHAAEFPLSSAKKRVDGAVHTKTPPAESPLHVATVAHVARSSPSSIPRPSVTGRSPSTKYPGKGKESEINIASPRNLIRSSPVNDKQAPSNKDKDTRGVLSNGAMHNRANGRMPYSPVASAKVEHKMPSQYERNPMPPRSVSPTPSQDSIQIEEPEEHKTPKMGLQHLPDSRLPATGPRPSSRLGTSSGFSSRGAPEENDIAKGAAAVSVSEAEGAQRHKVEESRTAQAPKTSVPSEPIDLYESDLDSFQEEEIAASSSVPRVHNGNNQYDDSDAASRSDESHADISLLGPRQRARENRLTEGSAAKRTSFLPTNFSPPPSPPVMPDDLITTTPQRRTSANTSKSVHRTPSPLKDMPALPGPPSSDEDSDSDRTPPVPITPASRNRLAELRTPRLPGAWGTPFATPAPAITSRMNTMSKENHPGVKRAEKQDEVYTPPASYLRAASMIAKTPALPGAWVQTPGTIIAKRHQQKVRFDEHETSASPATVPGRYEVSLISDNPAGDGSVVMKAAGKLKLPSPRTPGRIRVVDAFGNEITPARSEDRVEKRGVQKLDEIHVKTNKDEKLGVPDNRKAKIRVLDAMGREIDETQAQATTLASAADFPAVQSIIAVNGNDAALSQENEGNKLERKQALELLQKTIAGLKEDFTEADDHADTRTTDVIDTQMVDLRAQSIRAKEDRERLLRRIRGAQTRDRPSRSTLIWNALLFGKSTSTLSTRDTHFKVFLALLFLQIIIFIAFYQLTSLGARKLFLTTYIDPFYPELYLHIANPDALQLSMTSPTRSDMYASVSPSTWSSFFLATWYATLSRIITLRECLWDVWRDAPRGTTWPPT